MNKSTVCKRIYDLCLKYSKGSEEPAAYINIEMGCFYPLTEAELTAEFNRIKWDTPLSSAELSIARKINGEIPDLSLKVISLEYFESDKPGSGTKTSCISDGIIQD